jgi:hypothetical protein
MALYALYAMYFNVPKIRLSETALECNGVSFLWKDLESINLTGERRSVFPHQNFECMSLRFSDGKIRYLFPTLYANGPEIMSFLKQVVVDRKPYVPADYEEEFSSDPDEEIEFSFRRNQFLSFRGIMAWGFILFLIWLDWKSPSAIGLTFTIFMMVFILVVSSYGMRYFQITRTFLIIKTENLFWIKKVYHLPNIEEVVFETAPKAPQQVAGDH